MSRREQMQQTDGYSMTASARAISIGGTKNSLAMVACQVKKEAPTNGA
jgi:hypothetical protein